MQELPGMVKDYLLGYIKRSNKPVYFILQRDGRLLEWGGDTGRYCLPELKIGESIEKQLYYLEGLVTSLDNTEVIRCVNIEGCGYIDIHLIPTQEHILIVFLAVEPATTNEIMKLQRITQLSQCNTRISLAAIALYADLFYSMGIVVMEFLENGTFNIIGSIPSWFSDIYPDIKIRRTQHDLESAFPFLKGFIKNARKHWSLKIPFSLRSGIQNADDAIGNQQQYEAIAITWADKNILFVQKFK
ncbi:hypothetical protein JXI42_06780 [bacterium]|nr:hypothetical protein [bacterium]